MATVTGYTAEKIDELMAEQIVGGAIVGNDLRLNRRDGGTVNAGNVRGPAGPTGGVSESAMNAAIAAALNTSGKGIIKIVQTQVNQDNLGGFTSDWVDVDLMTHTFTPVAGRNMNVGFQVELSSEDPGDTHLHAQIIRTAVGAIPLCNDSMFVKGDTEYVTLNGSRTFVVPAWGGSQTFKMQIRCDGGFFMNMRATTVVCSMAIADLGVGEITL